jgi:bifunctional enzyme CysN/CysC
LATSDGAQVERPGGRAPLRSGGSELEGRGDRLASDPSPSRIAPLRFATLGSVDDGKSTLIGRLLHDSKSIFEDQLEHIEAVSRKRGTDYVDLALLTDGLRAEREQGITIDVAYRYFSTPQRDFVIADCPGHVQYTRNAITGASTADLAILLVDARHGVVTQTRRHSLLMSLLGVPHLVVAVNKMDLVGYSPERYREVGDELAAFAARLDVRHVTAIPICALDGDNIVERSTAMPWYEGPTLLEHLETIDTSGDDDLAHVRFPVQYVVRPQRAEHRDYRGYAGTLAAGALRPGDEVVVLPAGLSSTIERIDTADGPVDEARPGMALTLLLADDLDISRGDMVCGRRDPPPARQDLDAVVAWMDSDHPLRPRTIYTLKHTTRTVRAMVTDLHYRFDVDTLDHVDGVGELGLNEIGRVSLRATAPLFADDYRHNRATGSFVLIDEATNQTAGAGMVRTAP